ncbi:tRNA (mnm(5)s(2)U34)-methyltransferase [Nitratidesulfovibrio termitidis]|uniref:tRNA (mnm(5)s(2)U34)-methyltransferase n=1 Tax=Nitratidesulfovibrio termitidis TaxID=42252 RepID=UPI00041EE24D|nr:class I SAM-dependent methyltransferase [Nitratidesulfovibrio termitidis]
MTRFGSDDAACPGPCMELFGCSGGDGLPALRDLSQQAVAHALARALTYVPTHAPADAPTGTVKDGASGAMTGDVPWPVAVDGTAGNGHDTLFLARLVGSRGLVHAFDVQPRALARTAERLAEAGLEERVVLHGRGHEELAAALAAPLSESLSESLSVSTDGAAWPPRIMAAMFNLGFLPGSDRSVTTRSETTLTALEALLPLMVPGGVISLHVYAGHPGGADEAAALEERFATLDWNCWRVARYEFANKPRNPERLLLLLRLPGPV